MKPRRGSNLRLQPAAANAGGRGRAGQNGRLYDQAELGRRHKPDYWLLAFCVALLAIGLVVVYAIGPALSVSLGVNNNFYFVSKQLIAIGLSIIAFIVMSQVPLRVWRQLTTPLLVIACLGTLVALVTPVIPQYPAHRWVRLGSFSFQSVELLKFSLLLWLASFLAARAEDGSIIDKQRTLKPLGIILGITGVIVAFLQSDLGSMGVILVMVGVMAFVAGLPKKQLLIISAVVGVGVVLAVAVAPYRVLRLTTFLNPEAGCSTAAGYQACQALIAVGSGGMIGVGLGRSVQANGYLPQAANDSIFAIYAEIFGFVGVVILLGIFISFFGRLKRIAERSADQFGRLVTVGVLTWLSVQTFINIGAMIGLLPLKGITLPFISYGGTSIVFAAAGVGLVFQISRYTSFVSLVKEQHGHDDNRSDRRRVRGAYHPGLSSRERA